MSMSLILIQIYQFKRHERFYINKPIKFTYRFYINKPIKFIYGNVIIISIYSYKQRKQMHIQTHMPLLQVRFFFFFNFSFTPLLFICLAAHIQG